METIKMILDKDWYIYNGIFLGFDGENRARKLEIYLDNIGDFETYNLKFSDNNNFELTKEDGFLSLVLKSGMLKTGNIEVQIVATKGDIIKKSNVAKWTVLNSVATDDEQEQDGGQPGKDGKSAYELALEEGFEGTLEEWLASLKGDKGDTGEQGPKGDDGENAYDLAVLTGYVGSIDDWLLSLKGEKGDQGEQGLQGEPGVDGQDGQNGSDGFSPSAKVEAVEDGVILTITDKDGTTTAKVKNGEQFVAEVETDKELVTSDKPADALVVGNKISEITEKLTNLETILNSFEDGESLSF